MALPKLLQKLFQNGGAGNKLNPEIVPEIKKLMLGDHVLELQEDGTLKLDGNVVITSAGGLLSGALTFTTNTTVIDKNVSNSFIQIRSGADRNQGGSIELIGVGYDTANAGGFIIRATDGTTNKDLKGLPNGALGWGGKEVERVDSSGSGWIRYENGIQIVWGLAQAAANTKNATFTFPVAFKSINDMAISIAYLGETFTYAQPTSRSATKLIIPMTNPSGGYAWARAATVLVIGYWK